MFGFQLVTAPVAGSKAAMRFRAVTRAGVRGDVASAIWLSLLTSTIATAVLAIWAVPLAYALARVDFPGKRWALAMIDVPILVPQSVAGVALIVLLGPGSAGDMAFTRALFSY